MQMNHYNEMRGIYYPTLGQSKPPAAGSAKSKGVTAGDVKNYVGIAEDVMKLILMWQNKGGDPAAAAALKAQLDASTNNNQAMQQLMAQMQAQLAAQQQKKSGVEEYLPWIIGGVAVIGLVAVLATRK
jgi:hypothetical protein